MSEAALFWIAFVAVFWIGWPLWQIAGHLAALRRKANA